MTDAASWIPLFPEEQIPKIFEAIFRCMSEIKKQTPNELETSLNKRLAKSLMRDPKMRNSPLDVSREMITDDEDSDAEGRLDIVFKYSTAEIKPWPYFALEGKRLYVTFSSKKKREPLVSKYLGHQGMMCFITGRYAKGLKSGAMLGYVFDGDILKAHNAISRSIQKKHTKLLTKPPHQLSPSKIFSHQQVSETFHTLSHGDFQLFHILVAV